MKENTKIIISFILGILVSGVVVYAETILSSDKVSYNDTTVDKALDELYEQVASKNSITSITLLSQTEFTQEEFIELVNNGLQGLLQVGSIITLNNPYCETFVVIGTNHEGVLNSVDIMPTTQVATMGDTTSIYGDSAIRKWINGTYIESFDPEVQSLMKYQEIITYGETLYDKAKIMSNRDIGAYGTYTVDDVSGIQYEYFPKAGNYSSGNGIWVPAGKYGSSSFYWLRTPWASKGSATWFCVNSDNTYKEHYIIGYPETGGIVPVLRF